MPITLNNSNISVQYNTGSNYIIETVKSDLYRNNEMNHYINNIITNNIQTAPVTPTTYVDNSGNVYAVESYTYSGSTNTKDFTRVFPKNTTCDILIVGGGGGGARRMGGGGGAGALIFYPNYTFTSGSYNIKVGKGGDGSSVAGNINTVSNLENKRGKNGYDSEIMLETNVLFRAKGGGGGLGGNTSYDNPSTLTALDGGSGGGNGGKDNAHGGLLSTNNIVLSTNVPVLYNTYNRNALIPKYDSLFCYGNEGGIGGGDNPWYGSGGGGAGQRGRDVDTINTIATANDMVGVGGNGIYEVNISGTIYNFATIFGNNTSVVGGELSGGNIYYAGGGGGGSANYNDNTSPYYNSGGLGGGGRSGTKTVVPQSGMERTGGGGGGDGLDVYGGGNGGSGIVIIRYLLGTINYLTPINEPTINPSIIAANVYYPKVPSSNSATWTDSGYTVNVKVSDTVSGASYVYYLFNHIITTNPMIGADDYYHSQLVYNGTGNTYTGTTIFKTFAGIAIGVDYGRSIYPKRMRIAPHQSSSVNLGFPKAFKIFASDDASCWNDNNHSSWTQIHDQTTTLTITNGQYTIVNFADNLPKYRYYTMVLLSTNGNYSGGYLTFAEWNIGGDEKIDAIPEGNPVTHKTLNFTYVPPPLIYDFTNYNTRATWLAYAATIPTFTTSELDYMFDAFDPDSVFLSNTRVGWVQMTLPSTHNFFTITYGLGTQAVEPVRLLVNGVIKSSYSTINSVTTYSQAYNVGDVVRIEEGLSTMSGNFIFQFTNTNSTTNTYTLSVQPGTSIQVNNQPAQHLSGNYTITVGATQSSVLGLSGQTNPYPLTNGSSIAIKYYLLGVANYLTTEPSVIVPTFSESIRTFIHSGGAETQTSYNITIGQNTLCDILVVGGGGGGGLFGGGGGSGSILFSNNLLLNAGSYAIRVGKGGIGASNDTANGTNGIDSSITINAIEYIAKGGGGGGSRNNGSTGYAGRNGNNGGTGGGGSQSDTTETNGGISTKNTYTYWETYGNAGGKGKSGGTPWVSGGGGGTGSAGSDWSNTKGGNGGSGKNFISYFGTNVGHNGWFGGGGGGNVYWPGGTYYDYGYGNGGNGLFGGGGNGANETTVEISATSGLPNTGGGGGGGKWDGTAINGGSGGSGIVIIKFKSTTSISEGNPITHKRLNFTYNNDNLVAWYRFNGDYLDSSGNGHNLTNVGSTIQSTHIIEGQAVEFDSTDYLEFPATINPYTIWNGKGISFSCWVRFTVHETNAVLIDLQQSLSSSLGLLIGFKTTSGGNKALIIVVNNNIIFNWSDWNNPLIVNLNVWRHLVFCVDVAGKWDVYLDNVRINGNETANIPNITYNFRFINRTVWGSTVMWDGQMDDFRIYDRSLSSTDVSLLYNKTYPIPNLYTLNFPVPTVADINNNSNIVLRGAYDISLTTTSSLIIPKAGQHIPRPTTFSTSNMSIRYNILGPMRDPIGAQWTYNSSNTSVYHMGSVGIGTTNPQYQLDVRGNIYSSTGGFTQSGLTTWTVLSDRRIKENIVKASYDKCLENVKNIELYNFNFKENYVSTNDRHQLGFIAQEVQEVYPKAVDVGKITINASDANDAIENILTLNTTQIDYTLYGAVKNLIEKIEDIELSVEKLYISTISSNIDNDNA
jgi:hypothetical protein